MMTKKIQEFKNYYFVFLIPILIILFLWFLTKSTWFINHPKELSFAITLDLLLIMPCVYFISIRRKKISKLTTASVFVLGLVSATFLLPDKQQFLLSTVKIYVLPILELFVLSFLIIKAIQVFTKFKSDENSSLDFYDAIKISTKAIFPDKMANFLATEIAVFYYVLFSWKKTNLKENEFSNHKENGFKTLLFAFILVIFIETFAVHNYIEKWNFILAWVLSILSIYTAFQILALIKTLSKRPFYIDEIREKVVLRFGFLGFAEIPFSEINVLEINHKDLPEDKSIIPFSPLGSLGGHNVIFHLKNEIKFEGFYGLTKKGNKIAVFVDEKRDFVALVNKNINV